MTLAPSGRPLVRLFRVDTPHDIASAAIVADTLPDGRNILVFSTDKGNGDPVRYARTMRAIACLHPWSEIVDISGLPLFPHIMTVVPTLSRLEVIRATAATVRMLRRLLAPVFGLDPEAPALARLLAGQVDELYFNCFQHPDVQALYGLFPAARKIYAPHGFDSLNALEIYYHSMCCVGAPGNELSRRDVAVESVKKFIFGADAVPPRRIRIDEAYSFNLPMPWAALRHDFRERMNRPAMEGLFARLPSEIRAYYDDLVRQCGERPALLLLHPYHFDTPAFAEKQDGVLAKLAGKIIEKKRPTALLIKPHPRNGADQVRAAADRIAKGLSGTPLVVVKEHGEYPAEVVLAPFSIRACGTLGSGSIRTLRNIYGLESYCPERAMLELYSDAPALLDALKCWIKDHQKDYTAV